MAPTLSIANSGAPAEVHWVLDGTTAFFESIGIPAANLFAVLVGLTEFFGGLLLIVGLLTVATGLALIVDMIVAIVTATFASGFIVGPDGGWEFNFALIGLLGALALIGAGVRSLDHAIGLARAEATVRVPARPSVPARVRG